LTGRAPENRNRQATRRSFAPAEKPRWAIPQAGPNRRARGLEGNARARTNVNQLDPTNSLQVGCEGVG
jgi:hypothetical protein